ncbi:Sporulation kinase A [Enhygromyxa salina]|uniref:histidine kinase n=1 Tax=Enhygromyxa salina TaxID=215803 RepID=A0A2S9XB71_9BACT|nr:response regulator [Enhygromyxa salina]PRP90107.1 Sporulation kinase A [Enhygromyxa salina]
MARILVVDDERSLRRTFALFLRDDGHEVETAEDVDQALATLEKAGEKASEKASEQTGEAGSDAKGQFDVVVSDIILPRRSGVSLMEAIAERWPDIKVILVTGEPTVETAASAVRSGAYDYISKPVSSSKIRKVVASAARVKSLQDDNRRLQAENDLHRAMLAKLVEVRTAEVRDTREALASTKERISRIASNIPGVLLQFEQRDPDAPFNFTFMAQSAEQTFGINPEAVLADSRVFTDRVHPEDREDLRDSLARSAQTLSLWTWEGRIIMPSGDVRWFQAQSRPVRTEDGTVVWDGVMLDTSDRKDLQARLMLSDRMASIGTLAAGVAHEINNPLTYVLANLHILGKRADKATNGEHGDAARDQLCSQDTLQLLRETADGARRVRDIARDLKTFSRSSDEVQPVDVRQVLDSSVRMAINEIRHRAQLERNYMDVPLVLANSSRLGQVFLNLIVNAAQAIPEGAADDNLIRLETTTGPDGHAEVTVTDSGSGIEQRLIARIFEPFVTMKPVGVGTGLGLYICRDIILNIGGVIEVESEVGEGTSFKVRLPPAPADAVLRPQGPTPGRKREKSIPRARLLVIDDEPNIGRSFVRSLPEHDITVVDSGREGVRLLDEHNKFDLIFCDIMMPDVTGRDVHEQISERHPEMLDRIVFMTGGAFTERAGDFIERVNARLIDKPFDVATIRTVLREKLVPNQAKP